MIALTMGEIIAAVNGQAFPDGTVDCNQIVSGITLDSRKALQRGVFIALKGANTDGHFFVESVASSGCAAAIVEKEVELDMWAYRNGFVQIKVASTYAAVGALGAYIRTKSGIKVVGITGSVGKTSVKELTGAVLAQKYSVLKTVGNYNNEFGLPQTLFRVEPSHEWAALEMGISHFGEMDRLSKIAAPDIAVFTNIENVHTEYLNDRDGALLAKTELVANMRGDTLIMNGDDDKLRSYAPPRDKKVLYYGFSSGCTVTASDIRYNGIESTDFKLRLPDSETPIHMPALGAHMVTNALAAATVGYKLRLSPNQIKNGIESYAPVGSRMRVTKTGGVTILDDCYNASPASMLAALNVLALAKGRKIALLGDMLELGRDSSRLHYEIGRAAAKIGVALAITVGSYSGDLAMGAREGGLETMIVANVQEAVEKLLTVLKDGDALLIKASRGVALDSVAKAVTEKMELE